jgi:hypothetical protein
MLNGTPGEAITYKRGLRQGDPLSHMLFILVINTLNLMVSKVAEEGLLQPLSSRSIHHRFSLYVDDVVLFLRPAAADVSLIMQILQLFGEASCQKTNIQKRSAVPIHYSATDVESVQNYLPYQVEEFPIKYLGLPLSLKKLTRL